ncbi:hypothetical protein SISSUDRAFT_93308 [Sistotremastrum suecicum HHB10207 ss-3]|uniref:Uncharacterized protein n=1 Tax=Sistotremastrum suecicum HHB10207 ss-3 TaxID=1314776 RepID=A0A166B9L1_9AGAM|nr:hypothetical protein SISSUDRAFT_93308 [Sistotremastrum suecicum HHB10207 ss-3]
MVAATASTTHPLANLHPPILPNGVFESDNYQIWKPLPSCPADSLEPCGSSSNPPSRASLPPYSRDRASMIPDGYLPPAYEEQENFPNEGEEAISSLNHRGNDQENQIRGFVMAPLPNPVQHYATREVQAGSIVLSVASYSSSSSGLPIFVQGQDIVGNVSLPYIEGVRKVSITFRGFLQSKQSPSTVAAIYETAPIIEVESVLYSWIRSSECLTQMPFVIKVPTTTADSKALPSSFRGSKFSIIYELHLKIKRSGFKSKIEITRPCGLLRCLIPTSPTQNMLNSYMHRLPLPTSISPETGWYECSIAETYGTCRSGSGKISSKATFHSDCPLPRIMQR